MLGLHMVFPEATMNRVTYIHHGSLEGYLELIVIPGKLS